MRISTAALAAGIALAMSGMAQAAHHHRHIARVVIRTPVPSADAMWPVDYNIVPRYRYRPQDDRVDPYGPPVARGEPEPGGLGIGQ
jgi:hypothetical protein